MIPTQQLQKTGQLQPCSLPEKPLRNTVICHRKAHLNQSCWRPTWLFEGTFSSCFFESESAKRAGSCWFGQRCFCFPGRIIETIETTAGNKSVFTFLRTLRWISWLLLDMSPCWNHESVKCVIEVDGHHLLWYQSVTPKMYCICPRLWTNDASSNKHITSSGVF